LINEVIMWEYLKWRFTC